MSSKFNLSKSIQNAINNRKEDLKDIGSILRNVEVEQDSKEAVKTVRRVSGKINGKVARTKSSLKDSISGAINNNKHEADVSNIIPTGEEISSKELIKSVVTASHKSVSEKKADLDCLLSNVVDEKIRETLIDVMMELTGNDNEEVITDIEDEIWNEKELTQIATNNIKYFIDDNKEYLYVLYGDSYDIDYDFDSDSYYLSFIHLIGNITEEASIRFSNLEKLQNYLIEEYNLI